MKIQKAIPVPGGRHTFLLPFNHHRSHSPSTSSMSREPSQDPMPRPCGHQPDQPSLDPESSEASSSSIQGVSPVPADPSSGPAPRRPWSLESFEYVPSFNPKLVNRDWETVLPPPDEWESLTRLVGWSCKETHVFLCWDLMEMSLGQEGVLHEMAHRRHLSIRVAKTLNSANRRVCTLPVWTP